LHDRYCLGSRYRRRGCHGHYLLGVDVRVLQTLLVLILWPWWTLRACVLCALGVALIVSQSILGIWAKPKTSLYAQRKKPI
jgi:hypothetical protein